MILKPAPETIALNKISQLSRDIFVDLVRNQWNEILRELAEWNQLKIAHEALLATR